MRQPPALRPSRCSCAGTQALLLAAVVLAATAAGLAAQALAAMTRRVWLGDWPLLWRYGVVHYWRYQLNQTDAPISLYIRVGAGNPPDWRGTDVVTCL